MQILRSSATPVQLQRPCHGRPVGQPRSCRRLVVLAALAPEAGGETLRPKPRGVLSRLADVLPVRRRKCGQSGVADTLTGGGPPRLPPPRSGGGGGGGGDDDAGNDGEKKGFRFGWKGWDERVAADPQFVYKVLVEQIIGVGASVIGDMSTRPNWGLNELDFVFSTLVVGSIMNFTLMYLLAPTTAAAAGAASKNIFARLFDERTLTAMGAPGGHIFQPGFSFQGRMINLFFKSFTFGLIGFAAGVFGTTMSNTLIKVRVMTDPKFKLQNETPDVFLNALAWTAHMGLSSNIRYQTLNGIEMGLVRLLPPPIFKVFVVLLRTANNLLGGMSFVTCARIIGSQKENKAIEPPAPEPKKGKKKN